MTSKAKIKVFGTISENKDGVLVIDGFELDLNYEFDISEVGAITLIIQRLQADLEELKRDKGMVDLTVLYPDINPL